MRPRRPVPWLRSVLAAVAAVTVVATAVLAAPGGPTGATAAGAGPREAAARGVVLAVHGGAGTALDRDTTPPERARAYRDGLTRALRAGQRVLDRDGDSVTAVAAAVRVLEDDPLFNAGKGAVFTADAGHELDASVMRGSDLAAGAVAGVRSLRNPVAGARLVMEESPHVLLTGEGADDFGARNGLSTVTQDYYFTQARWDELLEAKRKERETEAKAKSEQRAALQKESRKDGQPGRATLQQKSPPSRAPLQEALADSPTKGTVGAVARDSGGDLAAATSTGGLTNKAPGRVGDSPLIGAGTYADNRTVAASATGFGEVFIRGAATATLSHLVEFKGLDVAAAAYDVIQRRLTGLGGKGGVIALAPNGDFAAPHSTPGMLHGYLTADGRLVTRIFPDESKSGPAEGRD